MNRTTQFRDHFHGYEEITLKEIYSYFHEQEKLNDNNIKVLLSRWTARNILSRVKKGVYKLTDNDSVPFRCTSDKLQKQMAELFMEHYPELKYSVWGSGELNRLTVHQHFRPFYIFETEIDVLEPVFYLFKERKLDVFMSNDGNILQRYMYNLDNPVVLKKLVSRSPLTHDDVLVHPALEKILVDICSDRTLFDFLQGDEVSNIYHNVFKSYPINLTKLLNYAERRNIKTKVESLLMQHGNRDKIQE